MSALYPSFKQQLLAGGLGDLSAAGVVVKAVLIDTGATGGAYEPADVFISDVATASIIGGTAAAQTLTSKTVAAGVFDAADVTFPAVTGASIEAVILYVDTGVATTSRLIAFLDGITVTPNGGSIILTWDNGASRIFAL